MDYIQFCVDCGVYCECDVPLAARQNNKLLLSSHQSCRNYGRNIVCLCYLVELFGHLADDLGVLHVPEHLDPHGAWLHNHKHGMRFLCCSCWERVQPGAADLR